jgi:hypothetical protein
MTPTKLDLLVATFSYGGNGGFASTHPAVGHYLMKLAGETKDDPRLGRFAVRDFVDTPITMTRNAAVLAARKWGADLLLMIDSDMTPDCELKEDSSAQPFWKSSFDYLYDHYQRGPVVIGAPYLGPPPLSNCYIFQWASWQNSSEAVNRDMRIEAYSREHAELMTGIQEAAALPTGLILFDMRAFELTDPVRAFNRLVSQGVNPVEARQQIHSWFYYEYSDLYEATKASTEDVTATRDMALVGQQELGYCPIKCNWDAWAGHNKPLLVRKPRSLKLDHVNAKYRAAVHSGVEVGERVVSVDFEDGELAYATAQ